MTISRYQKWWSYLWPVPIVTRHSELAGYLEVRLENGKLVINGSNSNYSEGEVAQLWYYALRYFKLPQNLKLPVLMLGYGAGSLVPILRKLGIAQPITAVEWDGEVLRLAQEYFTPMLHQVQLIREDALEFIKDPSQKYALILIDLFIDNRVPPEFLGEDFIKNVRKSLASGGSVYHNVMLNKEQEQALVRLYQRYFTEVRTFYKYENNLVIEARG